MKTPLKAVALLAALLSADTAHATWSVATLNQKTGTIVVAGASCSYMVYGIAEVVAGKGVVIVQASSNAKARADALEMLKSDKPLGDILKTISTGADYEPALQQYALLSFAEFEKPQTFTGNDVPAHKGSRTAPGISVQANTMVSDAVVARTFESVASSKWSTDLEQVEAGFRALRAGALAGGDSRCEGRNSSTAFITVFRKTDPERQPWLNLVIYGLDKSKRSAAAVMEEQFGQWTRSGSEETSTVRFTVPAR